MAGGEALVSAGATLSITSSNTDTMDARLNGLILRNEGTVNFSSGRIFCQP